MFSQASKSPGAITTGIRLWIGAQTVLGVVVMMVKVWRASAPSPGFHRSQQARQAERLAVAHRNPVWLLGAALKLLPLVETVGHHKAPPALEGFAKACRRRGRLG